MNESRICDDSSSTVPPTGDGRSRRARGLEHTDPSEVTLQEALQVLADPVRRAIVRELAACADWSRACGTFELGVSKATRSHHFTVLRQSGLVEQRDAGARRYNRLRRAEFDALFPGLLALVLAEDVTGAARPSDDANHASAIASWQSLS
ncbi:helix-turn-helix domain-containing protein [Kitasatospora sp. NPDC050463]|uniref:ArsR/SmtB family transcription factor n=1 Tax=Kitasatospora sp. NPDC050463 TaxID=3155786 RepID=UPI0033F8607C